MMQAFGAKTTGSALTPLLWAFGTSASLTLGLYWAKLEWPAHTALGVTIAILMFIFYVFNYLLRNDPNRLHSEAHLQNMRSLEVMGDSISGRPELTSRPMTNPFIEGQHER
jgi:hypothetical protein